MHTSGTILAENFPRKMVKERIQSNLPDAKSKERIESMTGNNKSLTKEK